jgi:lipopolysaccharide transport system ATP-binding protein
MTVAIAVQNLGKKYSVTRQGARGGYRTLRESLSEGVGSLMQRLRRRVGTEPAEDFWALRDVSFEVRSGEIVGIIGRNGAGKSTLLKILSRITKPTTGSAEIHGRIGSLLEVGTGFHPELTGRENIFLNGSILGMSRREIDRRFDEIVAFAEVEQFLETPVKRYSSGMYVRLAFSVATHLEPEILLVDEVLAVGDATYQKRCIDRMAQIAGSGRSVLFVSHNMDLIPRLCETAIELAHGRIVRAGAAAEVVERYLRESTRGASDGDLSDKSRIGDGRARFTRVGLVGPAGRAREYHPSGEDLIVRVDIGCQQQIPNAALAVVITTVSGVRIHSSWTREAGFAVSLDKGHQAYECSFRSVRFRPGQHMKIGLWLEAGTVVDYIEDALIFEVVDGDDTSSYSTDRNQGVVLCDYQWSRLEDKDALGRPQEAAF